MDKILFIDDEKDILKGYRSILQKDRISENFLELANEFLGINKNKDDDLFLERLEFYEATQGQEGVDIIKKHLNSASPIKIVFIDMRMPPGIDGKRTAKLIRELDPKIEIVIATAYSDTNLKEIVDEIGSPDKLLYLRKPFDLQEVKQIVLNLIVKTNNETIKDDFISNISHEIKTPLASICGFSQLILNNENLDDETREQASILNYSANLMNNIIEELLTSVEIKNKGIELNKKTIEIVRETEKIFLSLKPLFDRRENIEFILEKNECEEEFFAEIDPLKYGQCINNIVSNAEKFTEEGFVKIKISQGPEFFSVSIQDSGIGIEYDLQEKIFHKFSRIENYSHTIPGLGLGLSIVKQIVHKMKGIIEISSDIGKGTEIKLYIPYNNIN